MYYNKFAVYLTVNGKVLREDGEKVLLPFGTEYSIGLKNLESRLAVVKVSIDGEDVLNGNELVVRSNKSIELEGFMDGNIAKNKFKFVEKTKQIEDFRGNKPDDGLVRVSFRFKKQEPIVQDVIYRYRDHYYPYWYYSPDIQWTYPSWITYTGQSGVVSRGGGTSSQNSVSAYNVQQSFTSQGMDGITVKGSETFQGFTPTFVGEMEDIEHVIVLKLSGYKNEQKVEKELTVKEKIVCSVCGNKNNSNSKFCSDCGSFLR